MAQSSIEWTEMTWNPVTGCTKISPGCKFCYAERMSKRLNGMGVENYKNGFRLTVHPHMLDRPLVWKKPSIIFVNSMSDLFQDGVPDEYIEAVAKVMVKADWHTYQVLTKRSARMSSLLSGRLRFAAEAQHIWWGVSVEDKKYGLPRICDLQRSPARIRFLSIEPLLEGLGIMNLEGIHWAIVGGESGHGARSLQREWVTSIRDQCIRAKVPFFFKQWGGVHKKRAGRSLDGHTYDEFPERKNNPTSSVATALRWAKEIQDQYRSAQDLLSVLA